ncbi:MAG: Hsp20/alpha crystallin family protein [Patescibacteria group bacterium]
MAKKRSFFERLTGSVPVAYDDDLTPAQRHAASASENWQEESEEGELAVDVYQTPSEIVIQTMVSGVKPEDLQISITREMVTIKGKREFAREVSHGDYFQKELYWGSFSRSVLLPSEIEVEEAEALEKHGLLTIRLPKVDKNREQNLKVRSL